MNHEIALTLPAALALAIAPVALADLSDRIRGGATAAAVVRAVGWFLGLVVLVAVAVGLGVLLRISAGQQVSLLLGVLLIAMGVLQILLAVSAARSQAAWRRKARDAAVPTASAAPAASAVAIGAAAPAVSAASNPSSTILGIAAGIGRGFGVSLADPKNVLLALPAGIVVGALPVEPWQRVVVAAIVVVVGCLGVIAVLLASTILPKQSASPLAELAVWLRRDAGTITTVVLGIVGVFTIGSGISLL